MNMDVRVGFGLSGPHRVEDRASSFEIPGTRILDVALGRTSRLSVAASAVNPGSSREAFERRSGFAVLGSQIHYYKSYSMKVAPAKRTRSIPLDL